MTSQTQTAGLMMNKKERSTHKGDEEEKRLLKSEGVAQKNILRERERPFFIPQGWMKWYCKSGLLGIEIYRHTHTHRHTLISQEHTSLYMHGNATRHSDENEHFAILSFLHSHYTLLTGSTVRLHMRTRSYIKQSAHIHAQTHGIVNQGMLNQCQKSINSLGPM